MKKIMFAAVSALAISALADGVDSTQFGAMQVLSTAKRTLVAIPWDNTTAGGGDIVVSNLVLTANLTVNDTLDTLKPDGTRMDRWVLQENGGVKYWQSVTMLDEANNSWESSNPSSATVARGSSVVLIRQSFTNETGAAVPFFVMGQVATTAPETTIVAPSGTATNCFNLIAPPSTTNQYLNGTEHAATWSGTINTNDCIIIPTQYLNVELKYVNSNWCYSKKTMVTKYYKLSYDKELKKYVKVEAKEGETGAFPQTTATTTWTAYEKAIPVGTGFWYVSYGGTPTVKWSDVPTTK